MLTSGAGSVVLGVLPVLGPVGVHAALEGGRAELGAEAGRAAHDESLSEHCCCLRIARCRIRRLFGSSIEKRRSEACGRRPEVRPPRPWSRKFLPQDEMPVLLLQYYCMVSLWRPEVPELQLAPAEMAGTRNELTAASNVLGWTELIFGALRFHGRLP